MDEDKKERRMHFGHAQSGAVYGLGLIGALIYFWSHATSFLLVLYGLFQAIFWPAYLIYYAFQALIK